MPIFCLDTSTREGSMALWRDGAVTSVIHRDPRSHAERLPTEAVDWLRAQGVGLHDLDALAVVAGPGSFTGLRVGVAAIQGWSFAVGKPVVAIPTLDAVAADPAVAGITDAVVVPMIDGQRHEVFFSVGQNGVLLRPAAATAPAEAIATVRAEHPTARVVVIGDAIGRYGAVLGEAGWEQRALSAPLAEAAVRLAASGAYARTAPHALRPIYIRRPDAEAARAKRESAANT